MAAQTDSFVVDFVGQYCKSYRTQRKLEALVKRSGHRTREIRNSVSLRFVLPVSVALQTTSPRHAIVVYKHHFKTKT
ncbi:hypothetical protein PanWU01x14_058970 [Parasponia andersonii]|uniref:Uncharacterized protein n=1 Tax=Parasponia andersonii TaxID=3476 RepID=A0A2P5DJD2_PARAD|nr:hypothetical protein PanWU01x14_058970 [Parasponia andersonii]